MQSDESLRDELLAEVEAVAPILTEHALHSEKLGRLDEPTVEGLRKTRLLRFACPRDLGGDEADPLTVMEVLEAVARIDGSAGWTLGILALTSAIAGAFLPVKTGGAGGGNWPDKVRVGSTVAHDRWPCQIVRLSPGKL